MNEKDKLNLREKLAITLIIFAIKIIKPYQYDHEHKELFQKFDSLLKE